MDSNSITSKPSKTTECVSVDLEVQMKLRRLKIEEELLIQSLKKCNIKAFAYSEVSSDPIYASNLDFRKFSEDLKDSYAKIKDLFEEVKVKTCSHEMMKSLDIDEIKNNILELESNIKSLKKKLQSEMKSLKISEQELTKQVNKDTDVVERKKRSRISTATYKEIVPSPVKMMMSSPFKCLEVQQFQDFMGKNPKRYGGWNEYNHNVFKKLWHKHIKSNDSDQIENIINSDIFACFIEETIQNVHGLTKENVIDHSTWYAKYLNLKDRQQKAIDKWKSNRISLRKTSKSGINIWNAHEKKGHTSSAKTHKEYNTSSSSSGYFKNYKSVSFDEINREFIKSSNDEIIYKDRKDIGDWGSLNLSTSDDKLKRRDEKDHHKNISSLYRKPTKQWINRCSDIETHSTIFRSLEHTKKLRVPDWRQSLENYY